MKKRLPFNLSPCIITECWAFYRFGIIEANPKLMPWIINHYNNICIDRKDGFFDCFLGDHGGRYNQLHYYDSILFTTSKSINDLQIKEETINFVIDCINKEKYFLTEIYDPKLNFEHEILIYGYDLEKKCFYTPKLLKGVWIEDCINFELFWRLFLAKKERYKEDPWINQSNFHFPVTTFEVNQSYRPYVSLELFYKEIQYIKMYSKRIDVLMLGQEEDKKHYGVISVMSAFILILENFNKYEFFTERQYSHAFVLGLKKTCEYMLNFKNRLSQIDKIFTLDISSKTYDKVDSLNKNLNICLTLVNRFYINKQEKNIFSAKKHLDFAYKIEEEILDELCNILSKRILPSR